MKKPSDQKIKMCFIFSFEDLCKKKKKKNIYYKKQQKPQTNKQKSPPPQNKHINNTLYVQICIKIKPKLTPLTMDTITMA